MVSRTDFYLFWGGELQDAGLLGDDGALVLGRKTGYELGHVSAGLLRVEITDLLGNINKTGDDLVVTLFITFLQSTPSSTDLDRKLLTGGVSHELAGLLFHVLGAAGGLVHSLADLLPLAVTNLLNWFVTLSDGLIESLLLEGDLTRLLEVLLADLLLGRFELGDVGVVALLDVLVGALQDGLLLQSGDGLLLLDAAEPRLWVLHTATEVEPALDGILLLPPGPGQLVGVQADKVRGGGEGETQDERCDLQI